MENAIRTPRSPEQAEILTGISLVVQWLVGKTAARLFLILVIATYGALFVEQLRHGLEYDESYIMSVVRNLAIGNGYAGDGISFYSSSQYFDPQISTGPTLLLPGVLAWWISGGSLVALRIVPLLFFVSFLIALNLLLNPRGNPWALAAVAASPLLMTVGIFDLTTRSLVPGRFLGEIAALACLTLGAALIARNRFVLGGILAGLSITAKLHFVVPVATLLVVVGFFLLMGKQRKLLPRLALSGVASVVPLGLLESYKLFVLGPTGYVDHLRIVRDWAQTQSRDILELIDRIPFRLDLLMSLMSSWTLLWIGILVVLLALSLRQLRPSLRFPPTTESTLYVGVLVGYALTSLSLLVWWLLASAQDSPRQAIPTILILVSLLAAATSYLAIRLRLDQSNGPRRSLWIPALIVLAAFATVTAQGIRIVVNDSGQRLALDQAMTADLIQENAVWWVPRDGFWTNPEHLLLTELDYAPSQGASGLRLWTSIRALNELGDPDARELAQECNTPLFTSANAVLCRDAEATPPYALPFSVNGAAFPEVSNIFASGWNPPEGWGAWSSGQSALLTIPVDSNGLDALSVALTGIPFGKDGETARVLIKADGKLVGEWTLPTSTQAFSPQRLEFEVPTPIDLPVWTLDLEVQTPDATAPRDVGIPVEMGELGFGLTGVEIEWRP